jgi:hypothetical protein
MPRCVGYIRYEKVKTEYFLIGLPSFYNDKILFDKPKTLEEIIRKAKYLYDQIKGRIYFQKSWRDKQNENLDQKKKGLKPPFLQGNSNTY